MADELEKNGVTICTRAKVERIVVEKGRVRGVEANGRTIAAKAVVSNSGITNTIDNLAGRQPFPDIVPGEAAAIRVNNSSSQVYIGIRADEQIAGYRRPALHLHRTGIRFPGTARPAHQIKDLFPLLSEDPARP